jgi:competence protein ComEC
MKRWLSKKIHASWFIAWCSLGFLVGVAFSVYSWSFSFADNAWLIIGASALVIVLIKGSRFLIIIALLAGLIFGLWRGTIERQALVNYKPYYGKNIILSGKISEDTSYGPKGDQRLRLQHIRIENQNLPEEIWISTTSNLDIKRGDIVKIRGLLIEGFGNIPASMYRATVVDVVRPYPGDIARRVRDKFASGVRRAIPEPEASLGLGYLVGQRTSLPESLDQQIKTIGLTHAVVASGYNLTILVTFACGIFAKKSKYLAAMSGGAMILSFMLITGFSPSMSRAGLVSGLSLLAWYYGRKIHPFVLLPFAAAVTVLIRPSYIWGDIGWYLSFSAFIGVIILAPLLQHYFWGVDKKPHTLRQLFIDTISAQAATLPIILLAFHQYSQYALPANLLVLPLVPLAMMLTFVAGMAGLIAPSIASFFGIGATAILSYMVKVIGLIANLPGAKSEVAFSVSALVASYIALVIVVGLLWHKTKHNFRNGNPISTKNNRFRRRLILAVAHSMQKSNRLERSIIEAE